MTGRRTATVLVLACVFSVAVTAVLGDTGVKDWRVQAGAAAGAAVATFFGSLLQGRLTRTLNRREDFSVELAKSIFMPGRKPPLVRDITDPVAVGVHAAPTRGTSGRVPPYVPRDVDPRLRQALSSSAFVLLVGDAAVGKTRAAYEAMRAVLPGHVFIWPSGSPDSATAVAAARAERNCVLWLDSLQRYLGSGGLSSKDIAEVLAGAGHHRVVLATLRAAEESRFGVFAMSPSGGQLMGYGQAVLDQVNHRLAVPRLFSPGEQARASQMTGQDSRLAEALGHADRYGIAEYLSSGPQLAIEWEDAWALGTHPRAAALIAAAIDCRRAGFAAPLPRSLLEQLQSFYLDRRGGMQLRPEELDAAWEWATTVSDAGSSPLWPAGPGLYQVFDYLVDERQREAGEPVPEYTARTALVSAGPADAGVIGATAWYQGRPELAEAAFRQAYTALLRTSGPDDPATLAARSDLAVTLQAMGRLPDAMAEAEQRAILAARIAALGPEHDDTLASRNNLAVVLHARHRLLEAEAEYSVVLEIRTRMFGSEHPSTLISRNNHAVLLAALGKLNEAEAEHRAVFDIRARVLGPDHSHTRISRDNLGAVMRKRSAG